MQKKRGLRIMKVHVVKNDYVDNVVSCKITIAQEQKDIVENNTFWPKGIQCRAWGKKFIKNKHTGTNENRSYKTLEDSNGNSWWITTGSYSNQEREGSRPNHRQNNQNVEDDYWWNSGNNNDNVDNTKQNNHNFYW